MTYDVNSLLKSSQRCVVNSFGEANPDKCFYVIRQQCTGRGMFSLVASVLCHLDFAVRCGLEPVIDFENFPTVYNEKDQVSGTSNAWEYYFQPVSQYKLSDVYRSKRVVFSDNSYPEGYSYSITNEPRLYEVHDKYFKINQDIATAVDTFREHFLAGHKVLGVHFRGQEMRTAPGHWFPPSRQQVRAAVAQLLKAHGFSKIFVVTEEKSYLEFLKDQFGDAVVANDHFRTYDTNAYQQYPREHHMYQLGREILIDTLLLSSCHGLIGCTSNVATFARFANRGKYLAEIKINNGPNSNNPRLARYLWFIKNRLPERLGGFSANWG